MVPIHQEGHQWRTARLSCVAKDPKGRMVREGSNYSKNTLRNGYGETEKEGTHPDLSKPQTKWR